LVAIGDLGGVYEYTTDVLGWHVSMVITIGPLWIFAAPQQSPESHVPLPLFGLQVPLEKAFSHLDPVAPYLGTLDKSLVGGSISWGSDSLYFCANERA